MLPKRNMKTETDWNKSLLKFRCTTEGGGGKKATLQTKQSLTNEFLIALHYKEKSSGTKNYMAKES